MIVLVAPNTKYLFGSWHELGERIKGGVEIGGERFKCDYVTQEMEQLREPDEVHVGDRVVVEWTGVGRNECGYWEARVLEIVDEEHVKVRWLFSSPDDKVAVSRLYVSPRQGLLENMCWPDAPKNKRW